MAGLSRRGFLHSTAAVLPAVALGGCGFGGPAGADAGRALEPALLDALAGAVLPSELGPDGTARAVAGFRDWLAEYRAVAELDHGYGTAEVEYGPPDPAPGWRAQLEALDLEARRRHGAGFAELDADRRRGLVRAHVARGRIERLPAPAEATHVAVGLLAWFYASPGATDLCYRARIARNQCRPLADSPAKPAALGGAPSVEAEPSRTLHGEV